MAKFISCTQIENHATLSYFLGKWRWLNILCFPTVTREALMCRIVVVYSLDLRDFIFHFSVFLCLLAKNSQEYTCSWTTWVYYLHQWRTHTMGPLSKIVFESTCNRIWALVWSVGEDVRKKLFAWVKK